VATDHAYIGIGSNLGDPLEQVLAAIDELGTIPQCRLVKRSALYASAPMGPKDQPDYVNAVVLVATFLEPTELLGRLQAIERRHGRVRDSLHWGPRTLDLDLLMFGEIRLDTPELVLPHPGAHERCFVLRPLADLGKEIRIPGHGTVGEMLTHCDCRGVVRLDTDVRDHPECRPRSG
jgi:2-amino-4-hydroxy-6-hydroxymethyldihydropteridine diphosphokinase